MRDRKDDSTHRRVVETKLGRKLTKSEVAHHRDDDKSNNAPANLEAKDRGRHSADHGTTGARATSRLRKSLSMVKRGEKLY